MSETDRFRGLPSVEKLLSSPVVAPLAAGLVRELVVEASRQVLAGVREGIRAGSLAAVPPLEELARAVETRVRALTGAGLKVVVNATGTLLHTNLGRAKVPAEVAEAAREAAASYVDLELDLESGKRGNRYKGVGKLLAALTGAEDSLAVNNNAAAVLLAINTLAAGREVIVSRGELVEIGGAFRVPDIVRAAGARLVEVGTTNRTRASDYERAIGPETGLLMKTHTSNYRIVGFTKAPTTDELVAVGRARGVPVFEDLGSGSLVDLGAYGLTAEPTVPQVVASGVDLVSFSTDKLLGGPQGGILSGKGKVLKSLRANAMLRALRIDKVSMAMLERTLQIYLAPATVSERIPFYWAVARTADQVRAEAQAFLEPLALEALETKLVRSWTRVGGGACPTDRIETWAVAVASRRARAEELAARLRQGAPPVLGRIHAERLLLDFRTVFPEDREPLARALTACDRSLASQA